jgi:hypothetical protein
MHQRSQQHGHISGPGQRIGRQFGEQASRYAEKDQFSLPEARDSTSGANRLEGFFRLRQ